MDKDMRRIIEFSCEGSVLVGTLDDGQATTGLLIVSGGNEIRIGSHRGMAQLAKDIAAQGYPVFRFDRRGIGDSEGENAGFEARKSDIDAAIAAFQKACPNVAKIIAFGNCDAATALVIHDVQVDEFVLANPWVIETTDNLPPPAAIKDRYRRRLRDPKAWWSLLTGKINLRAAAKGLSRIAAPQTEANLSNVVSVALGHDDRPTWILLAKEDNTAIAFLDAWNAPAFAKARNRDNVHVVLLESSSHSFVSDTDHAALKATILTALAQ
jgi:exosortase A-associated hydrolase 1